jgi:SAM-dependent methyltransferase
MFTLVKLPGAVETATCGACAAEQTPVRHRAREMMHGLPGDFTYAECEACGSLWLTNVPDLRSYYPQNYYSFASESPRAGWSERLILFVVQELHAARFMRLCRRFKIPLRRGTRLLDVGCGGGNLLWALARRRYCELTGIDPYLERSTERGAVRLLKTNLAGLRETFDLIVFNHSLEHVVDIDATLRAARARLAPNGNVIVRVPIPNFAWRRYGVFWASLDPPRHITLMTPLGLEKAAKRAGFEVNDCVYDSAPFQFWGSEAYVRGQTLADAVPTGFLPLALHVLGRARYVPAAWLLNRRKLGDQASFLLTPART